VALAPNTADWEIPDETETKSKPKGLLYHHMTYTDTKANSRQSNKIGKYSSQSSFVHRPTTVLLIETKRINSDSQQNQTHTESGSITLMFLVRGWHKTT